MSYLDRTFCPAFCAVLACHRNKYIVEEAMKEGGFLKENPNTPIAWMMDRPVDCVDYKPLDTKSE